MRQGKSTSSKVVSNDRKAFHCGSKYCRKFRVDCRSELPLFMSAVSGQANETEDLRLPNFK